MRIGQSVGLGVCMVLCCLILGTFIGQPSAAQQVKQAPAAVGPFQLVAVPQGAGNTILLMVETGTGLCWYRNFNVAAGKWEHYSSPLTDKAK